MQSKKANHSRSCHQMSNLRLICTDSILARALSQTPMGSLQCSLPLVGFKGPTFKGRERKARRLCSYKKFLRICPGHPRRHLVTWSEEQPKLTHHSRRSMSAKRIGQPDQSRPAIISKIGHRPLQWTRELLTRTTTASNAASQSCSQTDERTSES